ncbi:MAG: PHP domain-containing protein, partial [Saprospiraceae bacterium]
ENPFKVRALQNAYNTLKKVADPILTMAPEALGALPCIGKAIVSAIKELGETGSIKELDQLLEKTPEGIVEMFNIKGIGPKKIAQFWHTMGLMSVGELIYYCIENRLKDAKGFGEKSQKDILEKAQHYLSSKGKWLYGRLEPILKDLEVALNSSEITRFQLTGQAYRKSQIVDEVIYIVDAEEWPVYIEGFELNDQDDDSMMGVYKDELLVTFLLSVEDLSKEAFIQSFSEDVAIESLFDINKLPQGKENDRSIFEALSLPYIIPELRWNQDLFHLKEEELIKEEDIRGVVHCHTTYSDGIHTVKEMCNYAQDKGYEYIVITDHSQSAFYASGLIIERVVQQHIEIDKVQKDFPNLKIFKSIESDILNDGSLDYPEDVLKSFDLVIGSIHSVLNMDIERATTRLVKAIENPHMHILGHMTGRLLLSRKGYPVDYDKIFDACAANNVSIELNANPQRLDMDHTMIAKAVAKGIKISINPDAHSMHGIDDIRYGVIAARAGGLRKIDTLNAVSATKFLNLLKKK